MSCVYIFPYLAKGPNGKIVLIRFVHVHKVHSFLEGVNYA